MSNDLKKQLLKLGSTNPELRSHLRPVLDALSASNRLLIKNAKGQTTYEAFKRYMVSKGIRVSDGMTETHALKELKSLSRKELVATEAVIVDCQEYYDPKFKFRKMLERRQSDPSEEFAITKALYMWEGAASDALLEAKQTVRTVNKSLKQMAEKAGLSKKPFQFLYVAEAEMGMPAKIRVQVGEDKVKKEQALQLVEAAAAKIVASLPPVLKGTTYKVEYSYVYPRSTETFTPRHEYTINLTF